MDPDLGDPKPWIRIRIPNTATQPVFRIRNVLVRIRIHIPIWLLFFSLAIKVQKQVFFYLLLSFTGNTSFLNENFVVF
jgi:hypothetical protein